MSRAKFTTGAGVMIVRPGEAEAFIVRKGGKVAPLDERKLLAEDLGAVKAARGKVPPKAKPAP